MKRLEAHGLVASKTCRVDCFGVQVWFLKDDLELLREAQGYGQRRRCWELTDEDFQDMEAITSR